jgi:FHS family L-fucose permease-like MFS transporter
MAISGGALIPLLQGFVADHSNVHISFMVPIFCYLYLAYYAWKVKAVLTKQGLEYDLPISGKH